MVAQMCLEPKRSPQKVFLGKLFQTAKMTLILLDFVRNYVISVLINTGTLIHRNVQYLLIAIKLY